MSFYIFKIIFSGLLIASITEIVKYSGKLGGIITALPLTTIIVLCWLYYENVPNEEISNYLKNTFYFILPTLPLFFIFPFLLAHFSFLLSISISIFLIAVFISITNILTNFFDV